MKIRYSERGLTFSFKETDVFKAGSRYRYIIDTENTEVILLPDENGRYKFSRKGSLNKPLVDLRNREIKDIMSMARYMEIEVLDDRIVVHIIKTSANIENLSDVDAADLIDRSEKVTLEIDKKSLYENSDALSDMLRAAGLFSEKIQKDVSYVFDTISLFSGAGLLDYPFKQDGSFDITFAVDFDKSACETYRHNIGNHIICMDIRELDTRIIPDTDLIIGGPCCQGYSNANRKGNTEQDISKRLYCKDV